MNNVEETDEGTEYTVRVSTLEAMVESVVAVSRRSDLSTLLVMSAVAALVPVAIMITSNYVSGGAAESVAWQKIMKLQEEANK